MLHKIVTRMMKLLTRRDAAGRERRQMACCVEKLSLQLGSLSPNFMSQVACRTRRQTPVSLAHAAAEMGFADQSHMNRVVRQLTGLTPRAIVRSRSSSISAAFRAATGGGMVYL